MNQNNPYRVYQNPTEPFSKGSLKKLEGEWSPLDDNLANLTELLREMREKMNEKIKVVRELKISPLMKGWIVKKCQICGVKEKMHPLVWPAICSICKIRKEKSNG